MSVPVNGRTFCRVTVAGRIVETEPRDGWRNFADTGLVVLVCNCGTVTGWISHAEMKPLIEQHGGWPSRDQLMTTAQDSAAPGRPMPVRLRVGNEVEHQIGTLTMRDGESVHDALAATLRAAADIIADRAPALGPGSIEIDLTSDPQAS